jgi:hypothetical protein
MLRIFVIGFGIVLAACSVLGAVLGAKWGMLGPFLFGVLILVGTVFERKYRGRDTQPTGTDWAATGEKFEDTEKGGVVEVWYNKTTGERRYVTQEGK